MSGLVEGSRINGISQESGRQGHSALCKRRVGERAIKKRGHFTWVELQVYGWACPRPQQAPDCRIPVFRFAGLGADLSVNRDGNILHPGE